MFNRNELEKAPDYGNMFFATLSKNAVCIDNINTSNRFHQRIKIKRDDKRI